MISYLPQLCFYTLRKEAGPSTVYKRGTQPKGALPLPSWSNCVGCQAWDEWNLPQNDPPYLAVQDPLGAVRKRPVRISSSHFHPMILYMETSHSSLFSIMSTIPGRRNEEEAGSLLATLKAHSLQCVPKPPCLDRTLSSNSPDLFLFLQASSSNRGTPGRGPCILFSA